MGFHEDLAAATKRRERVHADYVAAVTAAQGDLEAVFDRIATALFTRLRPLAALDWLSDEQLRMSCRAFAQTARDVTTPQNVPTPDPVLAPVAPVVDPGPPAGV